MFNRILVAVDNQASDHVFEIALFQAKATNARLMLLHVLPSQVQLHYKEWQDEEARGWTILHSFQAAATNAGITADLALLRGAPGRVIHDEADKSGDRQYWANCTASQAF